ncbi:MAG: 3-deoxy-D-manno-octulosonic acid transferase, partial [Burkholderiaceae bacterium]
MPRSPTLSQLHSTLYSTLYSAAWWPALPFALLRLWLRGRAEPGYRRHILDRLGFYGDVPVPAGPLVWLHAVSVGETRAAQPLVALLRERHPDHYILLTHMTPTGRATGRLLFGGDPHVLQCYLPYDTGWMSARFLRRFAPRLGILMETEVWPNMVAQCARHRVPVALVNARLSARSLEKGARLAALLRPAARALACVAAQTEGDAERLRQFGAREVTVTGSVKFDVAPPPAMLDAGAALRQQLGVRPVLLCASTRDGEEGPILDAFRALPERPLLVIVPRHPQRFDEVASDVVARGLSVRRRTLLGANTLAETVDVLLGDTMGEMFAYYAACDVAFIGGSLLPLGGQNLIE